MFMLGSDFAARKLPAHLLTKALNVEANLYRAYRDALSDDPRYVDRGLREYVEHCGESAKDTFGKLVELAVKVGDKLPSSSSIIPRLSAALHKAAERELINAPDLKARTIGWCACYLTFTQHFGEDGNQLIAQTGIEELKSLKDFVIPGDQRFIALTRTC